MPWWTHGLVPAPPKGYRWDPKLKKNVKIKDDKNDNKKQEVTK